MEEQISYSDNSHLIGVPLKIWQEDHCSLEGRRADILPKLKLLRKLLPEVDIHAIYDD